MELSKEKLKEMLVRPGHISEVDFDLIAEEAEEKKKDIKGLLIEKEFIRDEQLGQLIAESLGFAFVDLKREKIDEEVLRLVPEIVAESRGFVLFFRDEKGVKAGMINPDDIETRHIIEKRVGQKVLPFYITSQDLKRGLEFYNNSLKDEFNKILKELQDKNLSREEQDGSVVKIVDLLFKYGYQNKASDIHLEPFLKKVVVRFRIDGVMHKVLELPKELYDIILARIKILAKIRTDEHFAAQDGKLRFETEEETVDVRVSIVPVVEGENVVMRLLAAKNRHFGLSDLGLLNQNLKKMERAIKKPHGMILVTGPTGSGKSTTLYAVMTILNNPGIHISTIEDPVEYDIEGVSQIQVNEKTNLTFSKGLRAIVRQDPDIIMVGEIRDTETAGIAVNSALTGHLVLSTLHTNDAATTLPRLIDMDIEPFLAASTVNIIIAQRLVRKICEKCRVSYQLNEDEIKIFENETHLCELIKTKKQKDISEITFYKGAGCKVCGNTGYSGRIGIFEVLEMTPEIKDLVVKKADSDQITKKAKEQGMKTMLEDGLEKSLNAMTTLEEVIRVTKE